MSAEHAVVEAHAKWTQDADLCPTPEVASQVRFLSFDQPLPVESGSRCPVQLHAGNFDGSLQQDVPRECLETRETLLLVFGDIRVFALEPDDQKSKAHGDPADGVVFGGGCDA